MLSVTFLICLFVFLLFPKFSFFTSTVINILPPCFHMPSRAILFIHKSCLWPLAKPVSELFNNLIQVHKFYCAFWIPWQRLKSLQILPSCSFHISFFGINFLLVSLTFLFLKSHTNGLCWVIHFLIANFCILSFINFLWSLLTKQKCASFSMDQTHVIRGFFLASNGDMNDLSGYHLNQLCSCVFFFFSFSTVFLDCQKLFQCFHSIFT